MKYFLKCRAICFALGNLPKVAATFSEMGKLLVAKGQYSDAIEYLFHFL